MNIGKKVSESFIVFESNLDSSIKQKGIENVDNELRNLKSYIDDKLYKVLIDKIYNVVSREIY